MVKARRELTGGTPAAALVVSAAPVSANRSGQVTDALASFGLPTFEARTSYRVAYAETLIAGSAVVLDRPSSKAAGEIEAINCELKTLLTDTYKWVSRPFPTP